MKNLRDSVIIVNEQDEWLGTMEKMRAHELGILHRAFSIFIYNSEGDMLLQKRAAIKYHSGGLWTNACCSHPYPGESTKAGAHRRLQEELGFDCELQKAFTLRYEAAVGEGMVENEYDHCYLGIYNGNIEHNPAEIDAYKFEAPAEIERQMQLQPENFTPWFLLAFPKIDSIRSLV